MSVTPVGVPHGVGPALVNPPEHNIPTNNPPANNPAPPNNPGPTGKTLDGANRNESMWGMYRDTWENTHPDYRPTWTEFQRDFRKLNKQVGDDGYLNANDWYAVPTYGPGKAPKPPHGSGPAVTPQTGGTPQPPQSSVPLPPHGSGPAITPQTGGPVIPTPTGSADGSNPANAIRLGGGWETANDVVQAIKPQAVVLGVKGSIGLQDIPGWETIPGLRNLGADTSITYLGAMLIPVDFSFDGNGVKFAVRPQDATLFLSVHIPGVTNATNPMVFTVKMSDWKTGDPEAGIAQNFPLHTKDWMQKAVDKKGMGLLKGKDVVVFTNARSDVPDAPLPNLPHNVSGNFGFIVSSEGMKDTVKFSKDAVKKAIRSVQFTQALSAVLSRGASAPAAAASIAGAELLRGTIDNSLDGATFYWGFAWRGEAIWQPENGQVTIKGQYGEFNDKWVTFNIGDIPDKAMDALAPDSTDLDREWLISAGMEPERAEMMARSIGVDPKPLLDQTAAYLGITTDELIGWFNQQDKHWVASFAYNRMRFMSPDENEVYPPKLVDEDGNVLPTQTKFRWQPTTIEDLVWCAQQDGHPMPRGS